MKTIKKGCGYWDVTHFPYGDAFRRSDGTHTGEVLTIATRYKDGTTKEVKMKLGDGSLAVVEEKFLEDYVQKCDCGEAGQWQGDPHGRRVFACDACYLLQANAERVP